MLLKILWRTDKLLSNARNTQAPNSTGAVFSVVHATTVGMQRAIHAANSTGAVFSVVHAATVSMQRAIHPANNTGAVFSVLWSDPRLYNEKPAVPDSNWRRGRRRRRKGKSQNWDIKIWSPVPRDSDSRKTALARTQQHIQRQTHPLVREGARQKQDRDSQTVIHIWSWAPDGDWPTVNRNVT
jgi:hypothetical protein